MDEASTSGTVEGAEGGKVSSNRDLLKQLTEQGVEAMYAIEPLKWCEHLDLVAPVPEAGLNVEHPCEECQATGENWVCLICYKVFCSRFVKEHMVKHGKELGHPLVLSFADLSVWCYKCEKYLDNEAYHYKTQRPETTANGGRVIKVTRDLNLMAEVKPFRYYYPVFIIYM